MIEEDDGEIPNLAEIAKEACSKARQRALDSGHPIIESHEGNLVETFPDGTRKIIRPLPPRHKVKAGTKIQVKKRD